ncbi:MAG: CHC2 zinc finger domain-containing protein [Clostridiales bacterium]|nr:CHC2 zinc finger domain-containing protein [Clostridiales bacterium]
MNVYDAVKQAVTTKQTAELYGIKVNRNGMACCPYHDDRHPRMKVDMRFHCFDCQAGGSVIDFTTALYGLSVKEAAEKLASDFNVSYDRRGKPPRARQAEPVRFVRRRLSEKEHFQQAEQKCFRVYSDYLHLLKQWRLEYAPNPGDEEWHPLFVEALREQTHVEHAREVSHFSLSLVSKTFSLLSGKLLTSFTYFTIGLSLLSPVSETFSLLSEKPLTLFTCLKKCLTRPRKLLTCVKKCLTCTDFRGLYLQDTHLVLHFMQPCILSGSPLKPRYCT